jgi:hypothetical protein
MMMRVLLQTVTLVTVRFDVLEQIIVRLHESEEPINIHPRCQVAERVILARHHTASEPRQRRVGAR